MGMPRATQGPTMHPPNSCCRPDTVGAVTLTPEKGQVPQRHCVGQGGGCAHDTPRAEGARAGRAPERIQALLLGPAVGDGRLERVQELPQAEGRGARQAARCYGSREQMEGQGAQPVNAGTREMPPCHTAPLRVLSSMWDPLPPLRN